MLLNLYPIQVVKTLYYFLHFLSVRLIVKAIVWSEWVVIWGRTRTAGAIGIVIIIRIITVLLNIFAFMHVVVLFIVWWRDWFETWWIATAVLIIFAFTFNNFLSFFWRFKYLKVRIIIFSFLVLLVRLFVLFTVEFGLYVCSRLTDSIEELSCRSDLLTGIE